MHKKIKIQFIIKNRCFEVVNCFHQLEQFSLSVEDILNRTAGENERNIDDDDWSYIANDLRFLPKELEEYCLLTNHRHPQYNNKVLCLAYSKGWQIGWSAMDEHWSTKTLVFRRCSKIKELS